ncbi:methyl-accepting chemotaxis protein [Pseudoalteromonas tunicata]|uniref:methyl-accepting chemotaxis protein n=1 Tax=Pseudoalteromonas tunicata TaxID=314281 RepID=UPI00273DE0D7|nr:methyl-accepting chemotaxis protein [Pseudoalteromonas tunicata]MDP4983826.1 methyl-accepting chemotaxis protein [Pseudoalteromonas tunicata]
MKLTIGRVLSLSFSAVLLLMFIASLVVWQKQHSSILMATEVADDDVPGVVLYLQLLDEMSDMHSAALAYTLAQPGAKASFNANFKEFKDFHSQLVPLESSTLEQRQLLAKALANIEQYARAIEQNIFNVYSSEKEQSAQNLYKQTYFETGIELKKLLTKQKIKALDLVSETASSENISRLRFILELEDETDDLLTFLGKYLSGIDNAQRDFLEDSQEFKQYLSQLSTHLEPNVYQQIDGLSKTILKNAETIFTTLTPAAKTKAQVAVFKAFEDYLKPIESLIEDASADEIREAKLGVANLKVTLNSATNTLFVTTFLAIIIGIFIAWKLASSITTRLNVLTGQAGAIAKGNLSLTAINVTQDDELGELAKSINVMQTSLQHLISEISKVSRDVAGASQSLTVASQQINAGSQEQALKSHQIATAAEEMTATVNNVAMQTQEAAEQASEAGRAAKEGGVIMSNAVQSSERVAKLMSEIANTVSSLGNRSVEIGQVISVITSIAEQTNLLALNAAIEAARAGEAGRGFAVVADEVRGLAERTAKATKEVSDSITAIQKETETAVSRMHRGTEAVSEGVEHSKAAGDALEQIVGLAAIVNDMIQSIAGAAEEQTAVTKEITHDITSISDIANDSVSQTASAEQTALALGNKVKQLEGLIAEFKI